MPKKLKKTVLATLINLCIFSCILCFSPMALAGDLWDDVFIEGGLEEIGDTAYEAGAGTPPLPTIVANLIRIALTFLTVLFLAVVVYGGFVWMTAGGNEDRVGQARSYIMNGTIGVIIILAAYAITVFVIRNTISITHGG